MSGRINSTYGPRGSNFHDGIDIAAPEGTPIRAIERGEVIYSDQLRGYGNIVILRHQGGMVSVYAHNQVNLVREGQPVTKGEVIAKVGSTGRVTGLASAFGDSQEQCGPRPAALPAAVVLYIGIR